MSTFSQLFLGVALVISFVACSSSEDEKSPLDDPSSRESLQKAKPLALACKYTEVEHSSYRGDGHESGTPKCFAGRCTDLRDPSDHYVASDGAGGVYSSYTEYKDQKQFMGSCADPQPISCEGKVGADACEACVLEKACEALVLCANDANCGALSECFQYCGTDDACAKRCWENAEPSASQRFQALGYAVTEICAAECK